MMKSTSDTLRFTSFSWKRFVVALLLLIVGIIDLLVFSPLSGRHVPTGSIMTFEGPSYFLSTGLIPLIVGIILLLYCILSYFKGEFSKDNDTIVLNEKRFKWNVKNVFKKEEIIRISLSNNEIGIKYLWLFLFIPYLIINYYYMTLNFLQPFVIGLVNFTAVVILFSLVVVISSLFILYLMPQWYLKIYTDQGKYELWFEPFRNGRETAGRIAIFVNDLISEEKLKVIDVKPLNNFSSSNLILASFFLIYGLINVFGYMTTIAEYQTITCHVLIILGLYLYSNELRKLPFPVDQDNTENITYHLKSKYYEGYYYIKEVESRKIKPSSNYFDVFLGTCSAILFIVIPFKVIQSWMVINAQNIESSFKIAFSLTIFGFIILYLLSNYILFPSNKLNLTAHDYTIEVPFILRKSGMVYDDIQRFFDFLKALKVIFSDKHLTKQFILRLSFMLGAVLIAIILLMWQYFFYFNLFNLFNYP